MKFEKPISLKDIIVILGDVEVRGNADLELCGMNEVHVVGDNEITFVDLTKYYDKALNSKASAIIIDRDDVEIPNGKALLISKDPFADFNKLTLHFRPFMSYRQGLEKATDERGLDFALRFPNAVIAPTAEIGEGTVIQPNVFVGNFVKIGKNCIIHANTTINDYSILGDNVIIQPNVSIGGDACYFQRKDFEGQFRKFESSGRTIIEDDVEIGALCAIDRGVSTDTVIGQGTKMDNFVQIGHDTRIGKHCLIGSHCAIAGVTVIEDNVVLWANVMVNKDIVVGKGATVLATSAVDKSIEGGKTYFGAPAIEMMKKWRELVALRQLPDILEKLEKNSI
ncbi:MAG: UDP-3-O-(3-hydroxymyristoyl)glucosamine N-acyltransferase [Bacteroidales bacterium]|jgi:UDP-3-O-[3-hydroxymyristoyl] glucosamine N-acyltransferase|nr:UDP-3-O-(3-hydroxymyristoyl)glucosamine N-acyltransferase [Bacteroidales bacterium]